MYAGRVAVDNRSRLAVLPRIDPDEPAEQPRAETADNRGALAGDLEVKAVVHLCDQRVIVSDRGAGAAAGLAQMRHDAGQIEPAVARVLTSGQTRRRLPTGTRPELRPTR